MKKILLFILFSLLLHASDQSYELKIYDSIFSAIFPQKDTVHVWCDSQAKKDLLQDSKKLALVTQKNHADILLISQEKNISKKYLFFVTSYKMLQRHEERTLGGFYWKKGRPNILFFRQNLQKNRIDLPTSMQKYIEEEL